MQLILLGTTGYHPNDRGQTQCLLLPECGVMLDAGTALYRASEYLESQELDIFITHSHLDHVVGLTYLFSVIRTHPLKRITLHGQADDLRAVEEHLFSTALFPSRPPFDFVALPEQVELQGGGRLTHFPVEHSGATIGFRLDWPGRSMAYVTDTTADVNADYVEKIRGVDLLIHECFFRDSQAGLSRKLGHSNTTPVAEVARRAGVGRLVLAHFHPMATEKDPVGLEVAREVFPNTILGEDRMVLEF